MNATIINENFKSHTASGTSHAGIFCNRCGAKTYLSADGTHRRCPSCDD